MESEIMISKPEARTRFDELDSGKETGDEPSAGGK